MRQTDGMIYKRVNRQDKQTTITCPSCHRSWLLDDKNSDGNEFFCPKCKTLIRKRTRR